jgi:Tachylectin
MGFAGGGFNNTILVNGCQNLANLTVTLQVTQDLITVNNDGFSLQLNSYPQPGLTSQGEPLDWFQYIIYVLDNQLSWEIQYWANAKSYSSTQRWPPGYTPNPPNTSPWLPAISNDYTLTTFGSAPSSQIPAGSTMQIQLTSDVSGNVTSATFKVTDPRGNVSVGQYSFLPGAKFPIYGFQLDIVGPGGLKYATFSSGAGTLTYSVSQGALAIQDASTRCGSASQPPTGESSNTIYGEVTPASGATVSQSLYVPQLLSYGDAGTPGNVASPTGVGFAGWQDFRLLFAGQDVSGQSHIYAVNDQGQLLSYGDSGTIGNVSDPMVVGFGGWLQFKFLFGGWNAAGQGRIYAVNDQGQLLSYGDAATAGNVSDPMVVGFGGWLQFKFLFGGRNAAGQDRIYAVNDQGQLLSYSDDGTAGNVSDPMVVGFGGWLQFKFLFGGRNELGQDRIYAVNDQGQLLSYTDDGTAGNVSDPAIVGFGGWTDFKFLFAGRNAAGQDRIYAVYA